MAWPPPTISNAPESAEPNRMPDWLQRPEILLGQLMGDRYRITEVLGKGPLTWAFRGECQRSGRAVIVKMLPGREAQATEQFLWQVREAISVSHYEHSAVQSIVDFGLAPGGDAWLVRNESPGLALRVLIQQGRVAEPRALTIACQLTDALVAAHAQEVVHGRLKPENILVDDSNTILPKVRVVDFGLTRLGRGTALSPNEARLLGLRTRLYLPPSWTPTGVSQPRDDLYAVGVLLFEMLTGQPPFAFDANELESPQRQAPLGFSQCAPPVEASPGTEQLLLGLLQTNSAESLFNAQQLLEKLQKLLTHCANRRSEAPRSYAMPPSEEEDEVTRAVPAISVPEPPPGGRFPTSRPPAIAAFERPQFNPQPAPFAPALGGVGPAAVSIAAVSIATVSPAAVSIATMPPVMAGMPILAGFAQPAALPPDLLRPSVASLPVPGLAAPGLARPGPVALSPAAVGSFPPPAIGMAPVSLAVDLAIPESPRLSFFDKLKRLFGRSQRPPGF